MPESASGTWGIADIVSAAGGVVYLLLGLWLLPARRSFEGFVVLLATGISLAPLLMILVDPLAQQIPPLFGAQHPIYLLQIVVTEARITLWWAAFVAAAYLVKEFFERSPPAAPC